MPIKISKSMRDKLPEEVRKNIEETLWNKSAGRCFLCEESFNRASDSIEADHDVPESEGGATAVENLNLTHQSCNRAKRNARTVPIKPYLKLVTYTKSNGGRLKYSEYFSHFGIKPRPSYLTKHEGKIKFEFPDKSVFEAPIMSEENRAGTFTYVFAPVPRDAIFNDDECQPRTLKVDHAWKIYSDLQKNVLHEAPTCRIEKNRDGSVKLLMFDGQHKTVASWMMDRKSVAMKIYLDLELRQAIELVNSIQAKIKKLPLSPFELASKMSDEWENKFHEYEEVTGSHQASEAGFLAWLGVEDRLRGKQALQSALVQSILSNPDLRIMKHISKSGNRPTAISITEQTLKSKIIEKLLYKDALKEKGEKSQEIRDAEERNIILCLNIFNDEAFEPSPDSAHLVQNQTIRAKRMTYQAALSSITTLIKELWMHIVMKPAKTPMATELNESQIEMLSAGIKRLANHPAWTVDFDQDAKMQNLKNALERNQGVEDALGELALNLEYLIMGDKSKAYQKQWLKQ